MPSPPPTNPNETVFDLDHGQQIIIEMDTIFKRNRFGDPNPVTSLSLEHGGRCWSFTFEDGVWWRSEFMGDAERVPQLQIKRRATESERDEREKARREWEQRTQGKVYSAPVGGATPSIQRPTTGGGVGFSESSTLTDTQIRFPVADVGFQQSTWVDSSSPHTTPYFPSANVALNTSDFDPAGYPSRDSQNWVAPQPPSFPQGFPFAPGTLPEPPAPPPPVIPSPKIPTLSPSYEPGLSMPSSRGNHQINGGTYVSVGGRVENTNLNSSTNLSGSDNNVSWTPDRHQELNGHYQANWP